MGQKKKKTFISVFSGSQGHCGSSQPFWSANKSLNVFLVTLNTVPQIRLFSYVLFATEEFLHPGRWPRDACRFVLSDRSTDGQPMTRKKQDLLECVWKTRREITQKEWEGVGGKQNLHQSLNLPCTFWCRLPFLCGAWSPVCRAFGVDGWELKRKKRGISIRPRLQA